MFTVKLLLRLLPTFTKAIIFSKVLTKMSCCDSRQITCDMGFYVCMSCGTQQTRPVFVKPSTYGRIPSRPPYSRKKRFLKLLYNVWACRLPHMKESFIRSLIETKPKTSNHIMSFIRGTNNRLFKRYDCLAKLSQQLLGHEIESLNRHQICFCVGVFQKIEERRTHSLSSFAWFTRS